MAFKRVCSCPRMEGEGEIYEPLRNAVCGSLTIECSMLLSAAIDPKPNPNTNNISAELHRSIIGPSAHLKEEKPRDQYSSIERCYLQAFLGTI